MILGRIFRCLRRFACRDTWGNEWLSLPFAILLMMTLGACSGTPAAKTRSWLDERTAVTVTAQEPVAVFARDEQMRAMNVRDYAEIGAVEVNRQGERHVYLVIVSWSTIDRTAEEHESIEDAFATTTLWADDRPITLKRFSTDRATAGLRQRPYRAPTPGALESWYAITLNELRSLAAAELVKMSADGGDEPRRYEQWRSGTTGFANFVEYLTRPR